MRTADFREGLLRWSRKNVLPGTFRPAGTYEKLQREYEPKHKILESWGIRPFDDHLHCQDADTLFEAEERYSHHPWWEGYKSLISAISGGRGNIEFVLTEVSKLNRNRKGNDGIYGKVDYAKPPACRDFSKVGTPFATRAIRTL